MQVLLFSGGQKSVRILLMLRSISLGGIRAFLVEEDIQVEQSLILLGLKP